MKYLLIALPLMITACSTGKGLIIKDNFELISIPLLKDYKNECNNGNQVYIGADKNYNDILETNEITMIKNLCDEDNTHI